MARGTISGSVRCEELGDGALVVSAHSERAADSPPAAEVSLKDGPGPFLLELDPGTWWIHAALEQPTVPGARSLGAWCRDAVELAPGASVSDIEIVIEVPETVR